MLSFLAFSWNFTFSTNDRYTIIYIFGNEHVILARDAILNGGLKSLCC